MGLVKRIRNAWNGNNIPKAPTAADFNHAPAAQFGAYDPNAGVWSAPQATGIPQSRNFATGGIDRNQALDARTQERNTNDYNTLNAGSGRLFSQAQGHIYGPNAGGPYTAPAGPAGPGSGTSRGAGPSASYAGSAMAPPSGSGQGVGGYVNGQLQGAAGQSGPVAMGSVRGDDQGMAAARQALSRMQERSNSGWSQLDRMALDQAQRQAGQYEQAQRGAVQQGMAARGMRGSGMEMLGAMQAQQGGADRALDAATTLGVAGRDRAMNQTAQAAQLGMGINDQQFGQNAARAGAVDAFNQWASGKQDQAAAMAYQAAMARYQQVQQQRQQIMQGVGQGAQMLGGMFGGGSNGGGR